MTDTYTALVAEVEAAAGQAAERGAATLTKETLLAIRAAITTLQSQLAEAREVAVDLGASLAATLSLLQRSNGQKCEPRKAVGSNTMFAQMMIDYQKSLDRARASLKDSQ